MIAAYGVLAGRLAAAKQACGGGDAPPAVQQAAGVDIGNSGANLVGFHVVATSQQDVNLDPQFKRLCIQVGTQPLRGPDNQLVCDAQVFTTMEAATERCKALDAAKRSAMFWYLSHCHVDVLSALQVGLRTHLTHGRRVHGGFGDRVIQPVRHTLVTTSCDAYA